MKESSLGETTKNTLDMWIRTIETNVELSFLSLRKHLTIQFWTIALLANFAAWGFEHLYANPSVTSLPYRIAVCLLVLPLFLNPSPRIRFIREHQKSLFVIATTVALPILFGWNSLANTVLQNGPALPNNIWLVQYILAIFFFLSLFSNPIYSLSLAFLSLFFNVIAVTILFHPPMEEILGAALFMAASIFTAYLFMLLTQHQMRYVHQKKILTAGAIGARVAHELRTPLLSVSNFTRHAQNTLENGPNLSEEDLKTVNLQLTKVQEEILFSNQTIDMLLMSTRTAPYTIDPSATFDVSRTIPAALADYPFANSAEKKSIRYHGGTNFIGIAPEELVKHLLFNLMKNAFLSSQSYSNTRIHISHTQTGGIGVLTVSDNGPGIPGNIKNKVFEDFFTTRVTGDGTGLGLSFCKSFMTQIGGSIDYERRAELSVFTMRFPTKTFQ